LIKHRVTANGGLEICRYAFLTRRRDDDVLDPAFDVKAPILQLRLIAGVQPG
jgi:hypothetical protein